MSREPAVTYEGALRILGRKDRKWLERLNSLLGGTILAAGVVSAVAPAAVAPVLKEMFGWIEQKDEALKLLRRMLDGLPDRLRGTAGLERRELIIAAHSTIVVAAYFEVLREALGSRKYDLLEVTDEEKRSLAASATRHLYTTQIPAPSASFGFMENQSRVATWILGLHVQVTTFAAGLAASLTQQDMDGFVLNQATERYESFFLRLATEVPEFRTWVELNEHAATRKKLAEHDALFTTFQHRADALARVEELLRTTTVSTTEAAGPAATAPTASASSLRATIARANRDALDAPIIPESATEHYGQHLVFPTVREMFINPRHHFCMTGSGTRIEDESWWSQRKPKDDLDLRLVAHLSSATAARRPLLVLGHPGAGKSMLTRVLAARLPADSFTVVRVPLRQVSAHAPVHDQIQQALDRTTHRRVEWAELVEQSLEQVRVVIFDGLDELLHMAQTGLYGYLRAVQEFQRTELALGRPVVTIVTSRTVVTDRVDVPDGTPVIKLEEFDESQIRRWLDIWNGANAAGIRTGASRAMPVGVALDQRKLTAQPLLLLMMAIYVADPKVPMIDERISPAELYERLLTNFSEREAAKSRAGMSPAEIREEVERQLRHLSIAALGMYNRGRQDISAAELGADLAALERIPRNAAEVGHRVLGKFFFVHVAEAQLAAPDSPDRRYEFLHATFGEYLVARLVLEELAEVAQAVFSSRRGSLREPQDDLFFAMLSHEPVSTRQPTLAFVEEMCTALDENDRERMAEVLTMLIVNHRRRNGSGKFLGYRPRPVDHIRELSAYTANLVLLRVAVDARERVPLAEVFPDAAYPVEPWRSMLALWQAGLGNESWNGILSSITNEAGELSLDRMPPGENDDVHVTARLAGDPRMLTIARYGLAFAYNHLFAWIGDDWAESNNAWLAAALANRSGTIHFLWTEPPANADSEQLRKFRERIEMLLKTRASHLLTEDAKVLASHIVDGGNPDSVALASAVITHPHLLTLLPKLNDPALFVTPAAELMFRAAIETAPPPELESLCDKIQQQGSLGKIDKRTLSAIRQLLMAYHWPDSAPQPESYSLFEGAATLSAHRQ